MDNIRHLSNSLMSQFRDVNETIGAGLDLHESTKVRNAHDRPQVNLADLRIFGEVFYHLNRALGRCGIRGGDIDLTGVFDVHLHTRSCDDALDILTSRADEIFDLLLWDLHRHEARCIFGNLTADGRDAFLHFIEDVQAALTRLKQRLFHDGFVDTLDLDVHLHRCHTTLGTTDFKVHIAEMVLVSQNVREDNGLVTFLHESHGDTRHGVLHRNTGIHQSHAGSAHSGHRRRTIGLEDFAHDAHHIRESAI